MDNVVESTARKIVDRTIHTRIALISIYLFGLICLFFIGQLDLLTNTSALILLIFGLEFLIIFLIIIGFFLLLKDKDDTLPLLDEEESNTPSIFSNSFFQIIWNNKDSRKVFFIKFPFNLQRYLYIF